MSSNSHYSIIDCLKSTNTLLWWSFNRYSTDYK